MRKITSFSMRFFKDKGKMTKELTAGDLFKHWSLAVSVFSPAVSIDPRDLV